MTITGPSGQKVSPRLAPEEAAAAVGIHPPRRHVHEVQVAEDVTCRLLRRYVRRGLADHQAKLRLVVKVGHRRVGKLHRVTVADHRAGRFQERLPVGRERQLAVLEIVARHAGDACRLRQRRPQTNVRDRNALRVGRRVFELAPVVVETIDQSTHPRLSVDMRYIPNHPRHVHHVVPPQNARSEVVEQYQPHARISFTLWFVSRADCSTGPPKPSKQQSTCTAPLTRPLHHEYRTPINRSTIMYYYERHLP